MENIAGILLLATLVEGLVTYVFGTEGSRPWLRFVSLGLGVLAAVAYQIDLLALFGLASPIAWIGWIVSGLIIGRGSNYLNDIIGRVRS